MSARTGLYHGHESSVFRARATDVCVGTAVGRGGTFSNVNFTVIEKIVAFIGQSCNDGACNTSCMYE
jgi:hypothetical protein